MARGFDASFDNWMVLPACISVFAVAILMCYRGLRDLGLCGRRGGWGWEIGIVHARLGLGHRVASRGRAQSMRKGQL